MDIEEWRHLGSTISYLFDIKEVLQVNGVCM